MVKVCEIYIYQQILIAFSSSDAPEWLKSTDEVISTWKNISGLESGTTYELRVVATTGNVRQASHIERVTTDGIGK